MLHPLKNFAFLHLLCILSFSEINGSHIIGGDVTYELLGYTADSSKVNYAIEFIIYRDTSGIDFDFIADFGIFQQIPGSGWTSYQVLNDIPIGTISEIDALDDPCKEKSLSKLIIESGVYNFNVTLDVGNFNYMIAYQKCCRNWTISNILNPGESGAVYDILITSSAQNLGNNSPVFKEFPPTFVCQGIDFDFDHSAEDLEGDELRYSFCTPFLSGVNEPFAPPICCDCINPDPNTCLPPFDRITYVPPFNEQNPVGGSPQISIDSLTGRISGVPDMLGSYVVGVCVEEFREGQLIGSYRRDFEFNVEVCTPSVLADLQSDQKIFETHNDKTKTIHVFESCDTTFQLINLSSDIDNIINYKWILLEADSIIDFQEGADRRNLEYTFPGPGLYTGLMVINDLEKCVDTAFMKFDIHPLVSLDFEYTYDPCKFDTIQFTNTSVYTPEQNLQWQWLVDGAILSQDLNFNFSPDGNGNFNVRLEVFDSEGCTSAYSNVVEYSITEIPLVQNYFCNKVCPGDTIFFNGHLVTGEGIYEDTVLSKNGCDSILNILELLELPSPTINATDTIICNGDTIQFQNLNIFESGSYSYVVPFSDHQCDSIIYQLELEVSDFPIYLESDQTICFGDSIQFENRWVSEPGIYHEVIMSKSTQCDPFEHILELKNFPLPRHSIIDTILCEGEVVTFEQRTYDTPGSYFENFYNKIGCDSLTRELRLAYFDPLIVTVDCPDTVKAYVETEISIDVNRSNIQVNWSPDVGLSCNDCLNPSVLLTEDQSYQISIVDENGCEWSKTLDIKVDKSINCYLPNIISKHTTFNNINQRFFLQCDNESTLEYDMSIFDRWGNKVGSKIGLTVNNSEMSWLAQDFLPGVYVYFIEIIQDVEPKTLSGDVTIVR